jgi:hypothetical protein
MRTVFAVLLNQWRVLAGFGIGLFFVPGFLTAGGWISRVGISFLCLGFLLNLVVMLLNGGRMPVGIDEVPQHLKATHQAMGSETRAGFLADWVGIGRWYFSPGDIIMVLGLVTLLAGYSLSVGPTR